MNKVVLMGRLTRDPDVRMAQGPDPLKIVRYTLAVDRIRKGEADFVSCKCFGKSADFAEKHLKKGMKICVDGRIQTGKYDRNGETVYTTDVIVEHQEFCEKRQEYQDEFPEDMFA